MAHRFRVGGVDVGSPTTPQAIRQSAKVQLVCGHPEHGADEPWIIVGHSIDELEPGRLTVASAAVQGAQSAPWSVSIIAHQTCRRDFTVIES